MTAKEYLQRIRHIDNIIKSKIDVVSRLREISTKVGSIDTTVDKVQVPYKSRMEAIIVKIADLEADIDKDIDKLITLKKEVMGRIDSLTNNDHKLLLNLRYLNLCSWEEIAVKMSYTYRWTLVMHGRALKAFDKILRSKSNDCVDDVTKFVPSVHRNR